MADPQAELIAEIRAAFSEEGTELIRLIEGNVNALANATAPERDEHWLRLKRNLHTFKGAAAAAARGDICETCHRLEERLAASDHDAAGLAPALLDELFAAGAELRTLLRGVPAGAAEDAAAPAAPSLAPDLSGNERPASAAKAKEVRTVSTPPRSKASIPHGASARTKEAEPMRVRPERIDGLHALVGDVSVIELQQRRLTQHVREAREKLGDMVDLWKRHHAAVTRLRRQLPSEHASALEETSKGLGKALQSAYQESFSIGRDAAVLRTHTATVISSLDDGIRGLRLMPVEPFLSDFVTVAREAARECGKSVRVQVRSGGVEIDRAVLVRLREPLLHLVRNAVVHGIELPEQRRALGKEESGLIGIDATSEGSLVRIVVGDDGGGVRLERVWDKALELGFIEPGETVGPQRLLEFLAHPGFSTHGRVDALAGRGIGMDIVVTAVRDLGGDIEVDTSPSTGSRFTLTVPISASTGIGLVVRVGEHAFGILLNQIERVVRVASPDVVMIEGRPVVRVGGDPLALVSLADVLGLPHESGAFHGRKPGVLLQAAQQRVVLLVDDIPGEQAMVIKPLGRAFERARIFLGGVIQPDNSILPVLQVAETVERGTGLRARTTLATACTGAMVAAPPPKRTVLVVDDSLTMSMLERNILRGADYEVLIAQDGVIGLSEFTRNRNIALVITDLEMPHMDGFGLCHAIRTSDRPETPIIMVTSVNDEASRRKAVEAGADAYIVKGDFEQTQFLRTVARLIGGVSAAA